MERVYNKLYSNVLTHLFDPHMNKLFNQKCREGLDLRIFSDHNVVRSLALFGAKQLKI